ncbi:MAG: hypothetical protein QMC11_03380 [Rhodospirillales bacterium]
MVCFNSGLRTEAVPLFRFGATVLFEGKEEIGAGVVGVGVSLFNIVLKRSNISVGSNGLVK